jgi:ribosomal protein S18 acetylase RimI-like enzyme
MEIRFAIPEDVPGILELLRQVGQVHHRGRPDIFRATAQKYGPSQVLSMLDKSDTPIFVAVEADKVLGYGFCIMEQYQQHSVMNDRQTLYIDDICVDETARGSHIGKALYEFVSDFAKQNSFDNITLNVWAFNKNAYKFYEKCGMTPQKIIMEKTL